MRLIFWYNYYAMERSETEKEPDYKDAVTKLRQNLADINRQESLLLALRGSPEFSMTELQKVWDIKNRTLSEIQEIHKAEAALEKDREALSRDARFAEEGAEFINREIK